MGILSSCFFVVVLITWTTCHPVVGLGTRKRALSTLTCVLFPQLPFLMATKDLCRAVLLRSAMKKLPVWGGDWTLKKSFLVVKGGIMARPSETDEIDDAEKFNYIIDHEILIRLASVGCLRYRDFPSTSEINDKSKANWLAKSITLLQLTWFTTNFFYRVAHGYKVSRLEVVTMEWIICGTPALLMWWQCPQNIAVPNYVPVVKFSAPERESLLVSQPVLAQLETLVRDGSFFHASEEWDEDCYLLKGFANMSLVFVLSAFTGLMSKFYDGIDPGFDTACGVISALSTFMIVAMGCTLEACGFDRYHCGKYVELLVSDHPLLFEQEAKSCDRWPNVAVEIGICDVIDKRQWQRSVKSQVAFSATKILVVIVFAAMLVRLGSIIAAFVALGSTPRGVYDVPKTWVLESIIHVGG